MNVKSCFTSLILSCMYKFKASTIIDRYLLTMEYYVTQINEKEQTENKHTIRNTTV